MRLNRITIISLVALTFIIIPLLAAILIPIDTKIAKEHCNEIETRYSIILGQKSAYEEIEEKEVWKQGDDITTGDCYLSYSENKVKLYIL